jgi:hypothetical protein
VGIFFAQTNPLAQLGEAATIFLVLGITLMKTSKISSVPAAGIIGPNRKNPHEFGYVGLLVYICQNKTHIT